MAKVDFRKKPWNNIKSIPQYDDLDSIIMQEADLTLPEMDIVMWLKDWLNNAVVD